MKIKRLLFLFLIPAYLLLSSCGKGNSRTEPAGASEGQTFIDDEAQEVSVMVLRYGDFNQEIISTGKLKALRRADLQFRTAERIASVNVRNGDRVAAGAVIASLDNFTLNNTLRLSRDQYERSLLEFRDLLIGQGYSQSDTALIPDAAVRAARIRSGLDKAAADLEMAEYNLRESVLKAPYAGVVANLFTRDNDLSVPGKAFCTVIDDRRFEAEFPVLEGEIVAVRQGHSVRILPFMTDAAEIKGVISSVNPLVDANGMVKVTAVGNNTSGTMFEGMNVKVIIGDKVSHQLVIPRQAVVLRSEKQVVFTYMGGRAKWVYVTTGAGNTTSFTVTEGLHEGDSVITEGSFNLNHDSRVIIK